MSTMLLPRDPMDKTSGAVISDDRLYRYSLWRCWDSRRARILWVMLNPSTADGAVDDPTIRRCKAFSCRWGFGSLTVVNLFAFRTSTPAALHLHHDPVGPENDQHILSACGLAQTIIAAWGVHGGRRGRIVTAMVAKRYQGRIECLGVTKNGSPRHPLYLHHDTVPTYYPLPVANERAGEMP